MFGWITWLVKGERKVSREKVVRCFLEAEFQKDGADYADLPDRLPDLLKKNWAEIEAELKNTRATKKVLSLNGRGKIKGAKRFGNGF